MSYNRHAYGFVHVWARLAGWTPLLETFLSNTHIGAHLLLAVLMMSVMQVNVSGHVHL